MDANKINKYVTPQGDFEFPNFLYHSFNTLMKSTLDLGNLACTDANQLRAYKETVKRNFKSVWSDVASWLEEFDFITPCTCSPNEYCTICGGSRFVTNSLFNSDVLIEANSVFSSSASSQTKEQLQMGLEKMVARLTEQESNQNEGN